MLGYRVHRANASLDTVGMIAELDVIEQRYVGPVDRARFYRHVARVSQRVSRRGEAMRYYLRAAMRDPEYRRHGLPSDLVEIARGAGRETRSRLLGVPVRGAINRRRTMSTWVDEAIPWLEDLRVRWLESAGGPP
jgi:GNAT superfamily N-acetyltransferase